MTTLTGNDLMMDIPFVPVADSDGSDTLTRVQKTWEVMDELWNQLGGDETRMPPLDYDVPEDFTLTIVIPVYNEARTILDVLARVNRIPIRKEIIVVDDCSTDGTRGWLETVRGATGLRLIFKQQNEGKGAALRTGFEAATGDVVIVQDADLEYDPTDIPAVIKPLVLGEADVSFGSRYLDSRHNDRSLAHRLLNRGLTGLSNLLNGMRVTDMETCYKAFRRDVLKDLRLKQNRFGFEPEVTAKIARRGWRLTEVPISYEPRSYAQGKKIGVRDLFNALWCIVRYGMAD